MPPIAARKSISNPSPPLPIQGYLAIKILIRLEFAAVIGDVIINAQIQSAGAMNDLVVSSTHKHVIAIKLA